MCVCARMRICIYVCVHLCEVPGNGTIKEPTPGRQSAAGFKAQLLGARGGGWGGWLIMGKSQRLSRKGTFCNGGSSWKISPDVIFLLNPKSRFWLWLPRETEVPICTGGGLSLQTDMLFKGRKRQGHWERDRRPVEGRSRGRSSIFQFGPLGCSLWIFLRLRSCGKRRKQWKGCGKRRDVPSYHGGQISY